MFAGFPGRTNPAFSKPCLCLSDTRLFRHCRHFRGVRGAKPLFSVGRMQTRYFRRFRWNRPFLAGDKNTVYQKHGLCHPEDRGGVGWVVPKVWGPTSSQEILRELNTPTVWTPVANKLPTVIAIIDDAVTLHHRLWHWGVARKGS